MAAYAKIKLVSSVFHPSDIAFARGWAVAAPGYGGWRLQIDDETKPEQIAVVPPGADSAVFVMTRGGRDVQLARNRPGAEPEMIGDFESLRHALLLLCPLSDDALVDIQDGLEERFPRTNRGQDPR